MKGYMLSGSFYECYYDGTEMTDGYSFEETYGVYTTLEAAKKDLRRAVKQVESLGNYKDYSGSIMIHEFEIDKYHKYNGEYMYICGVDIRLGKEYTEEEEA